MVTFLDTDRIVIKYYGNKVGVGASPEYEFEFGGSNPVRTTFPVPASNLPFSLDTLSDVTISGVTSGQVLSYDGSEWENKTIISGTTGYIPKFNSVDSVDDSIIFQSGSTIEIQGDLETSGSIASSTLTGVDSRVVVADSSGTLQPTLQTIIDAYIDPNGSQAGQLNTTSNWSIYGEYIGTPISDTFQGQRHYNIDYFFECVNDNEWIRLIRG